MSAFMPTLRIAIPYALDVCWIDILEVEVAMPLDRIAPSVKRKRTQFIRDAVKAAIRKQEYAQMRDAYRKHPDSALEADNWSGCEKVDA
jgi:hypothetical protein